jgi:hypothetical protein
MKTTSDQLNFALAVAASVWTVFAGGFLYFVNHGPAWPGLVAVALVAVMWAVRQLICRTEKTDPKAIANQRKITQSVMYAALMLGFAFIARLGWNDGLGEFGERSHGVIMGLMVVFLANAIPKQISSARRLPILRVAGWALVLGGLGNTIAWLLLPLAFAGDAATLVLFFAFSYAVVRIFWICLKHRSAPPTESG